MTRLRQILVNLVSNAIKFTHAGEISIQVQLAELAELDQLAAGEAAGSGASNWNSTNGGGGPLRLHFCVRDTGIGIPPEKQDRLFKSFSQVDASTTRKFGGTGLGLAISKRLAELMGGEIWVESAPGHGSAFHFTIQVSAVSAHSPIVSAHVKDKLAGVRLLVVDDSPSVRRGMAQCCRPWGVSVLEAESAVQALATFGESPCDLVAVDVGLSDMNFTDLISEIKGGASNPVHFLLLQPVGHLPQTQKAGNPAQWISTAKPVKASSLQSAILRALDGGPAEAKPIIPAISRKAVLAERLPMRLLVVDDNLINQKVMLSLLQRMGYKSAVANNGLEAVEAVEAQDYELLFMDVQMSKLDGIEATRRIRALERERKAANKKIRPAVIIALTARAMAGDRENCLAAGMDDFLTKPIRAEALEKALEHWGNTLHSSGEGERLAPKQAAIVPMPRPGPANKPPMSPPVDMERLLDFSNGDSNKLRELVQLYLTQMEDRLGKINQALQVSDANATQHLAHGSAGASSTCGMGTIASIFAAMERLCMAQKVDEARELYEPLKLELIRIRNFLDNYLRNH